MPEFEKKVIAKCDHCGDEGVLKSEGGYHNVEKGNDVLIYACPVCQYLYLNFDGEWVSGRWTILTPEETHDIEGKFTK